jgi:predicted nucleotidyltransferase
MNLADSISIRILQVMAEDPAAEYYQREIASKAGVSIGATSQKIITLVDNGLVNSRKSGRMLFYKYNFDNPVSRQFKILLNVNTLNDIMPELIKYIKRLILFGSCAEGTNVKDSDIDLFILSEEDKTVRQIIKRYAVNIGKKISPIILNASAFKQLRLKDKPLYERINRGIILWEVR